MKRGSISVPSNKNHSLYLNGIEILPLGKFIDVRNIYVRNNAMNLINGNKLTKRRISWKTSTEIMCFCSSYNFCNALCFLEFI
jgi:hypothetical protein